jgi:predicted negative regulator of RcsB-dependent stress response
MFNEEAGKLLDQKTESTIKHAVELYGRGDISYERYMELIEEVSQEEEARGAAYGGAYARNSVFEFAQKALDRAKDQAYALSLTEAKKQYELERQKAEQSLKEVVQQYLAEVQTITQQYDAELKTITQGQKEEFVQNQGEVIERTKAAIEQIISIQLQEERKRREQEIREEEALRPAREAAWTAIGRVATLEKKIRTHQQLKRGLVVLGWVFLAALLVILLFLSVPQWGTVIAIAAITLVLVIPALWKSPISIEKVAAYQREIALYQTGSGDYAPLSEEERCALLVQRIV